MHLLPLRRPRDTAESIGNLGPLCPLLRRIGRCGLSLHPTELEQAMQVDHVPISHLVGGKKS